MLKQQYRERLASALSGLEVDHVAPVPADRYVASSLLQKALRRGDRAYAMAATARLLTDDPPRLWRRLAAIVFEDFGLSDLETTHFVTAAASDALWRKRVGGDWRVATYLVARLAVRPRDRRVDECYMAALRLSEAADPWRALAYFGPSPGLVRLLRSATAIVLRCEQRLASRSYRALLNVPCDKEIALMGGRGWADPGLQATCLQGRRTSKCLLPVLLPLLKHETERHGDLPVPAAKSAPDWVLIGGVPSYALDVFTRYGRQSLEELVRRHVPLRAVLRGVADPKRRREALGALLFAVEGGVCTLELDDPLYAELKAQALCFWSGLPPGAVREGLAAMREALPQLNAVRTEVVGGAPWTP